MNAAAAIEISVDGRPMTCRAGQTLAAALMGSGIDAWRTTRRAGTRRGLFCGIGVCFDCLVTVNDEGPLRACLVTARAGDRVTTGAVKRAATEGERDDRG